MIVEANGITLYYCTFGSGSPMLLLHGNGEDHTIFDALADKLQVHAKLYAVDSRNHGKSEKTGDYTYETMAEDIYCTTKKLGLAPAMLIGFSDGAIIGLMLAMRHPQCLSKAALLGVNLSPDDFTPDCLAYLKEEYTKAPDPLTQMMLEQPQISLEDVRDVRTPVLLVSGEDDLFRPQLYPQLAAAMPNARSVVMPGHTHDSYLRDCDLLYPELSAFFGF